ncbi:hypothetical protein SynWH8103_01821 [Synechococcus sp. WH 8103]|nr:hypothetical protein SynWH8103_01821 [Synechococcus sp. WH 8103]
MLVELEHAAAIVGLRVELHPEREALRTLGFAPGFERCVEVAFSYGFVLLAHGAKSSFTLAFALATGPLKFPDDFIAASVEVGNDPEPIPNAVLVVLVGADRDGEPLIKDRQWFADAVLDLHPAEAVNVLNQQDGAVVKAAVDKTLGSILLPAGDGHLDGVGQSVVGVGSQPLVVGPFLSRQA